METMTRLNLTSSRHHNIKSDYGVNDYYKYYRQNGGKLNKTTFSAILLEFNRNLYPLICTPTYHYKLPKRMGIILIDKFKNYIKFVDGKVQSNLPVNWQETMKLWETDLKAKENKTLVRYENKHSNRNSFKFKYKKKSANYKNKSLYRILINRGLKNYLTNKIQTEGFDTSKLLEYDRI